MTTLQIRNDAQVELLRADFYSREDHVVLSDDMWVELDERAAAPALPVANRIRVFSRDDGAGNSQLCFIDSAGVVVCSGGGVAAPHNILSATHLDAAVQAVSRGSLIYGDATPDWNELVIGGAATFLRSDGVDPSWSAIQVTDLPAHDLLSAQHGDTVVQAVTRGSLIYGDATPDWNELVIGPQYAHLESDGVDVAWQANLTMADDAWIGLGGAAGRLAFDSTPAPDQIEVTAADLNFVTTGHGIIHVDGVGAGPPRQLLIANGTRYVPGTLAATDLAAHNLLSAQHGDTNPQIVSRGSLIYGNAIPDWDELTHPGGAGYALVSLALDLAWDQTPAWTGQHTFGAGWLLSGGVADLDGIADALVLDGDGDTTISAPTDDQIDIEIAGADDFTFTANAFNVLSGSDIVMADGTSIGQAAGPLLTFDDTNNFLEITGLGRVLVGSGTNDANVTAQLLSIDGDVGVSQDGALGAMNIYVYGVSAVVFPTFRGRSARTSRATPAAVQNNDILARFGGAGYGATAFAPADRAFIQMEATQTWTDANQGAEIVFKTTPNNSTTSTIRGKVAQDGKWGVGNIAAPAELLHLDGGDITRLLIESDDSVTGAGIVKFANAATTRWEILAFNPSHATLADRFIIREDGSNIRLVIDTNGNVAVGNLTAPLTLLHVYHATNDVTLRTETGKVGGFAAASYFNDARGWSVGVNTSDNFQIRDVTGTANRLLINTSGHVYPGANKTQDLGLTGTRWRTLYQGTSTAAGTSRVFESTRDCPLCSTRMVRGTGSLCILGEDRDYEVAHCPDCGVMAVEEMKHLPQARLAERRPPPKIEFLGLDVFPMSGNSRKVQACFRYVDGEDEVINSTFLGETELADLMAMDEATRRTFLLELGRREWEALEELRIQEEEVATLQKSLDELVEKFVGVDLLQ